MTIKVAIAGNIINFGVNNRISSRFNIEEELENTLEQDFAIFDYVEFKSTWEGNGIKVLW